MFFSIIIPVFNEEGNISDLIKEIYGTLSDQNLTFEVIVVNDASRDSTQLVLEKILLTYPIKIIKNEKNMGQSFSLLTGIKSSSYKTIITIDGDGQNNPLDIIKLVNTYKKYGSKLVSGIRLKRKDTYIKKISSKIANRIRSFILNDRCLDTGCSLKVFDKEVFLKLRFFSGIHRFIPALFLAYGHKATYVNVDHRFRKSGKSKYGTLDRLFIGTIDLIRVIIIINKIKLQK